MGEISYRHIYHGETKTFSKPKEPYAFLLETLSFVVVLLLRATFYKIILNVPFSLSDSCFWWSVDFVQLGSTQAHESCNKDIDFHSLLIIIIISLFQTEFWYGSRFPNILIFLDAGNHHKRATQKRAWSKRSVPHFMGNYFPIILYHYV